MFFFFFNDSASTSIPCPASSFRAARASILPSSLTFFILEDLMRLWVRSGVQINLPFSFLQLEAHRTPRLTRCFTSRLTLLLGILISLKNRKQKTTLPEALTCIAASLYVSVRDPRLGWRILTPFPFKVRGKACVCGTHLALRID